MVDHITDSLALWNELRDEADRRGVGGPSKDNFRLALGEYVVAWGWSPETGAFRDRVVRRGWILVHQTYDAHANGRIDSRRLTVAEAFDLAGDLDRRDEARLAERLAERDGDRRAIRQAIDLAAAEGVPVDASGVRVTEFDGFGGAGRMVEFACGTRVEVRGAQASITRRVLPETAEPAAVSAARAEAETAQREYEKSGRTPEARQRMVEAQRTLSALSR